MNSLASESMSEDDPKNSKLEEAGHESGESTPGGDQETKWEPCPLGRLQTIGSICTAKIEREDVCYVRQINYISSAAVAAQMRQINTNPKSSIYHQCNSIQSNCRPKIRHSNPTFPIHAPNGRSSSNRRRCHG